MSEMSGVFATQGTLLVLLLAGLGMPGCSSSSVKETKVGRASPPEKKCEDCRVWRSPALDQGQIIPRVKGQHIGNSYNRKRLYFKVGVEQWEQGKRSDSIHQRWHIECAVDAPRPSCLVERLFIMDWKPSPSISIHEHNTEDGTLRLNRLDWQEGVLDMTLVVKDGETINVGIRFEKDGGSYYLKSFTAAGVHRSFFETGEVSAIEYRVPDYTYTLNVALEMKGMKDAGLEEWDALFSSLSQSDQEAWRRYMAEKGRTSTDNLPQRIREKVRKKLPDFDFEAVDSGKKEMTKQEEEIVGQAAAEVAVDTVAEQIGRTSLSPDAKRRILQHVREKARLLER